MKATVGSTFVYPLAQLCPVIKKRLVCHLGHGIHSIPGERDEPSVLGGEMAQHGQNLRLGLPSATELTDQRAATSIPGAFAKLHQPYQGSLGSGLLGRT